MRKILIPIDSGSSAARVKSAVAEAVAFYHREAVVIHLLSVQVNVKSHVAMFFKSGEPNKIQHQAGAGLAGSIFGSLAGQVRQPVGGTSDCQALGS